MSRMANRSSQRSVYKELPIYIVGALVFSGILVGFSLTSIPETQIMKWFGVILFSSFVFGQFLYGSRVMLHRKRLWIVFALAFTIHVLLCVWLFQKYGEIDGPKWFLLAVVEVGVLAVIRRVLFGDNDRPK